MAMKFENDFGLSFPVAIYGKQGCFANRTNVRSRPDFRSDSAICGSSDIPA
jgi:hypothetical protein